MFLLAKVSTITPATVTLDSDTRQSLLTCLGQLGWCDTDRIVSISCRASQDGQGKYCHIAEGDCHVLLLPMVSLTNVANVNDPIGMAFLLSEAISVKTTLKKDRFL